MQKFYDDASNGKKNMSENEQITAGELMHLCKLAKDDNILTALNLAYNAGFARGCKKGNI